MRVVKISVTFIIILTLILSNTGIVNNSTYAVEKDSHYSGQELFQGIFFGVGPAAENLGELWPENRTDLNNDVESLRQIELITSEINSLNPNYFNELQSAIYSKNYIQTESLFTDLNDLIDQALTNLITEGNLLIENDDGSYHDGISTYAAVGVVAYLGAAVTTGAAVTHIVLVTAGGVAAAYLAVVGGKYFWNGTSARTVNMHNDSTTDFEKEQFLDYIIQAYN